MTAQVEAIYEDGRLLLSQQLPIPAHSKVTVTVEYREEPQPKPMTQQMFESAWSHRDVFDALVHG